MKTIPKVVPPLPRPHNYKRNIRMGAPFGWIKAGWKDLLVKPLYSLFYGFGVFVVSAGVVTFLFYFELDYILFPALAGFMVIGPLLAVGLYEKSRRIAAGEPLSLGRILFVRPKSGGQVAFTGVLLCVLTLLWNRAAVLLYALTFGLRPFPGIENIVPVLLHTTDGLVLLGVGTVIGGIFAALALALSAFSIPMLLNERVDALTAMGTSVALVWHNLPVMLVWGAIVCFFFALTLVTDFVAMIVIFPLLGHATWHAYTAFRPQP